MDEKHNKNEVTSGKPLKVLLAVGDQQTLSTLAGILSRIPAKPYHLLRSKTLEQTVAAMSKGLCDVVILNYYWGKTRVGDKVLEWVKAKKIQVPVIVMTSTHEEEVDRLALQKGAADYLVANELTQSTLSRSIRYAHERKGSSTLGSGHLYQSYDYLTNLPNRLLFQSRLERTLKAAETTGSKLSLMVLDLSSFGEINELYGAEFGDRLLQLVAAAINQVVGNSATVARIGSDEFGILQGLIQGPEDAQNLAELLLDKLSQKVTVNGKQIMPNCDIGISLYPSTASTSDELYSQSYTALKRAKQDDFSCYHIYTDELLPVNLQKHSPQHAFVNALANNEIGLYFNPRIHASSQEIIAIEVNPYWSHPQKGLLEYDQFLWHGLDNDIATRFTEWLLGTSFEYFTQLNISRTTKLIFNIEFKGLFSADFPGIVEKYLDRYSIDPRSLEFDLSKVAIEKHSYMLETCMDHLNKMGVTFGINNFGSEELSLSYISKLPISVMKLSTEFLETINETDGDHTMVKAMVDFAHSLGKKVVIEGLHSQLPVEEIHKLGFDAYKSFFSVDAMSLMKFQDVMKKPGIGQQKNLSHTKKPG